MKTLPANYLDCEQGTRPWFEARLGCVTSSRAGDCLKYLSRKSKNGEKGDESAARKNLRITLLCERLTRAVPDHYVSEWMQLGKEREPLARTAYELKYEVGVETVGLAMHPTIKWAAASPDGLVGSDGLIEFKCPKQETHFQYLYAGVIPEEYRPQMLWQLSCDPDRKWNDFVSYHPEFPEEMQLFVVRMERPENLIAAMEAEVCKFLAEVDEMMERLQDKYGTAGAETHVERKLKESIAQVHAELGITKEDVRA